MKNGPVRLNRLVALKVQRAGTFATEENAQRFICEAHSIAQLTQPVPQPFGLPNPEFQNGFD